MLPNFLQNLLQNSAVLSAAILLLTVLTRTLRHKTPPRLRLYCWLLVAAGLLLPVRPTLYTVTVPEPVAASLSKTVAGVFDTGDKTPAALGAESKTPGPAGPPSLLKRVGDETEAQVAGDKTPSLPGALARPAAWGGLERVETQPPALRATPFTEGGLGWIPLVWAAGALGLLALLAARHIRFRLALRRWSRPAENAAPLAEVCAAVRLRRIPRLLVCPLVATPVVVGLFRPTFILPDEDIPPERLQLMLLHEAVHCKRGDLWAKLLSLAALTAHWFNPLVHLLNRAVVTETELACDAEVLRTLGEGERFVYGQTILSAARRAQRVTALSSAFSSGGGKSLKRRLRAIVERRKTRRVITLLCTLLLLGSLLCGLLASCSGIELDYVEEDGEITADTGEGIGDTAQPVGEDIPAEPSPEPPAEPVAAELPQTDSLTLYIPNVQYWKEGLAFAVAEYEKIYPDVEVTVEYIGEEYGSVQWREGMTQYHQRVGPELMAGSGPDLVVVHKDIFPDIRRTMDSGVFLDLNAFVERDAEFDMSVLNQAVMDAGVYKGKRYLMPYSYFVPSLLGLQSKLDAVGFDAAQVTDFASLFEELNAVLSKAKENPAFVSFFSTSSTDTDLGVLSPLSFLAPSLRAADLQLVDYEREIALPDEAGLKAFCEAYKPYWQSWEPETAPSSNFYVHFKGFSLFDYTSYYMPGLLNQIAANKGMGYGSALLPFRALDGGVTAEIDCAFAVNAASQNQRNAWNFVRMMYDYKIQVGRFYAGPADGFPARKNTMRFICEQLGRNMRGFFFSNPEDSSDEITSEKLYPADWQPILEFFESPVDCVIPTSADVLAIFEECMTPYFSDAASYEECVGNLHRKLSLYVSE
jgi:beta-lactamase regulating signal transducer with metallopeptidase domain/ABC-type glycerol-3-phosphate transport system substrate-binding protein